MKQEQVEESIPEEESTEAEWEVLDSVGERGSVPVDDLKTCLEEVRNLIARSRLILVIVQRDWGVEFNIQVGAAPLSRNPGGS